MKHGNFWMTTIGAGVVIAGMMAAGRTAMQSPALLFLAGQLKVAVGRTDEGLRLMNQAAIQRESGTVHAAEPSAKPTEVCTEKTSIKTKTRRPAAVKAAKAVALPQVPPVLVARLEMLPTSFAPVVINPAAFRYLNGEQLAQVSQAGAEFQKARRERFNEIRRATQDAIRHAPAPPLISVDVPDSN